MGGTKNFLNFFNPKISMVAQDGISGLDTRISLKIMQQSYFEGGYKKPLLV
jgi:hypothetical protein